jgi:hypothetical protein
MHDNKAKMSPAGHAKAERRGASPAAREGLQQVPEHPLAMAVVASLPQTVAIPAARTVRSFGNQSVMLKR